MEQDYQRHLRGEDGTPADGSIDGKVGDVQFDDAHTFHGSRCMADNAFSRVYVEIEIYPDTASDAPGDLRPDRAHVWLHLGDYVKPEERKHVELYASELELFAVALSRAVENARSRGFLPTKPTT